MKRLKTTQVRFYRSILRTQWTNYARNKEYIRKILATRTLILRIKEKTAEISRTHKEERRPGYFDTHRAY